MNIPQLTAGNDIRLQIAAMLPTNSWQEVSLNKCKAMPDSEEKYQKLKELAKSFQDQKRLAASLEDSENEHICDYYLQKTQQAINALSPEYELAERARMIEQANREREELRALREKEERRPGRPAPSVLFDSDQLFARGLLSRERKEEDSPPRCNSAIIMELTDGWQKRYWDCYKAMPNSKEKYQKLKQLAETLEEQRRIAGRKQNFLNLAQCQTYLDMTENAINALSPKYEGQNGWQAQEAKGFGKRRRVDPVEPGGAAQGEGGFPGYADQERREPRARGEGGFPGHADQAGRARNDEDCVITHVTNSDAPVASVDLSNL